MEKAEAKSDSTRDPAPAPKAKPASSVVGVAHDAGGLLALQRAIGNQATVRLIAARRLTPGSLRGTGGSTTASGPTIRRTVVEKVAEYEKARADPSPAASSSAPVVSGGAPVEERVAAYETAVAKPSTASSSSASVSTGASVGIKSRAAEVELRAAKEQLAAGKLPTTLKLAAAMNLADIKKYPTGKDGAKGGPGALPLLMSAFGSNWFFVKDCLISNRWPDTVPTNFPLRTDATLREELMWRMIGLRTWEYNNILELLRTRYEGLPGNTKKGKDVLEWGSAGSVTLSSDVDINLKGESNMLAVADFNAEFARRAWPYEAGIVYDVNVYCKDNMWKFDIAADTGVMTTTSEPNAPADLPKDQEDAGQQEVAAMVKLIRFLSHGHPLVGEDARPWEEYKRKLTLSPQLEGTIAKAEGGYATWVNDLEREKNRILTAGARVVDRTIMAADHVKKYEAAVDMQASNRLYERKIQELIRERTALADAKTREVPNSELLGIARRVRQLVLEAGMFANEAMITAGASQFVVYGTQLGTKAGKEQGREITIKLTEAQFFHAFTEQLADTVKEFNHFDRLDDGLLKGGKYLMRMTLAADQLDGVKGNQANILNMQKLRKLGDYAMTAKDMSGPVDAKVQAMDRALRESALPMEKRGFLDVLTQFGADVSNAYQAAKGRIRVDPKPVSGDADEQAKLAAIKTQEEKRAGAEMRLAETHGADLSAAILAFNLGLAVATPSPAPRGR